jgi:metal-dependent amidase/aminoacylase/carboxypeptidase family protein
MPINEEEKLDSIRAVNEITRLQLQQSIDQNAEQVANMVGTRAQLLTQSLSASAQRAELLAAAQAESIGQGAARAIQQVVASPDFLQ